MMDMTISDAGPVPFDELDLLRLPLHQRRMLAALLASHPFGLTHERLGDLVYMGEHRNDPKNDAARLSRTLCKRLHTVGWACGVSGDRKGVKLFHRRGE